MSRRSLLTGCLAALTLAGLLTGCGRADGPTEVTAAFLTGWSTGALDDVPFITPTGAPVPSSEVAEAIPALVGELREHPPDLTVAEVTTTGDTATARIEVEWPLPGGATWQYESRVRLADGDDGWRVIWEPAVIHPDLIDGDELQLRRLASPRAEILDAAGAPLVTARPITVIGIWPSQVTDLDSLLDRLDAALTSLGHALDLSDLPARVEAARADDLFVEVITLRRPEYQQIEAELADLPGILTREGERHLAPTRTFARALLGTVGEVTAEVMEQQPGVFEVGDLVGYGGLAERYDEQLRGVVGQAVVIARPGPDGEVTDQELDRVEPEPGTPLQLTLDPAVQQAAEQALAAEDRPAALVAIRVSDGEVLAVANTEGAEAHPINTAFTGAVPPGSTFKLVSAYGLLTADALDLQTRVACPAHLTIEGFTIGNAFDGDRGEIPFQEAMAISCNTAFASLAPQLGDDGLATAAAALGIGKDWDVGAEAFTGAVPTGGSALDQAVAAFGQGETLVSPLTMAQATAAVARGAWLPPTLVVTEGTMPMEAALLPEQPVLELRTAMRAVVTDGTATELRNTPGGDVYGKTGTAEAGPKITHGWFVGWQDDLAFAVFVENGRSSSVAVPLADQFLRNLHQ